MPVMPSRSFNLLSWIALARLSDVQCKNLLRYEESPYNKLAPSSKEEAVPLQDLSAPSQDDVVVVNTLPLFDDEEDGEKLGERDRTTAVQPNVLMSSTLAKFKMMREDISIRRTSNQAGTISKSKPASKDDPSGVMDTAKMTVYTPGVGGRPYGNAMQFLVNVLMYAESAGKKGVIVGGNLSSTLSPLFNFGPDGFIPIIGEHKELYDNGTWTIHLLEKDKTSTVEVQGLPGETFDVTTHDDPACTEGKVQKLSSSTKKGIQTLSCANQVIKIQKATFKKSLDYDKEELKECGRVTRDPFDRCSVPLAFRHEVALRYLTPRLRPSNCARQHVGSDNTLEIHLRSNERRPNPLHVQPPCAFYDKVIVEGGYKEIRIHADSMAKKCVNSSGKNCGYGNPCAFDLLQRFKPHLKISLAEGDVLQDACDLISAKNIVLAASTFSSNLIMMNANSPKIIWPVPGDDFPRPDFVFFARLGWHLIGHKNFMDEVRTIFPGSVGFEIPKGYCGLSTVTNGGEMNSRDNFTAKWGAWQKL